MLKLSRWAGRLDVLWFLAMALLVGSIVLFVLAAIRILP